MIKGRKRHIIVDSMGCLLIVRVHVVNIHESRAAYKILPALFLLVNTLKIIWADSAYKGKKFIQWMKQKFDCNFEVVEKKKQIKDFKFHLSDG